MSLSEETVGGINFLASVSLTKKCEDKGLNNRTYVYTYDNAGNIKKKETYELTVAESTPMISTSISIYGYTSSWGDKLTSYRGVSIIYDDIGNPLSYYNGSSYSFSWTGRQLTGATKGGITYSFTYNGFSM